MILGIHHASITTPDLDRLKAFYCEQFGFVVAFEASWDGGNPAADAIYGLSDTAVRMAMLRTGNAYLELFEFARPQGRPPISDRPVCDAGYSHICLAVEDIDREFLRLSETGMRFHCEPRHAPGLGKATYGRDPDGNIVELMQVDRGGAFDLAAK